ncbi:uncharacterized protein MELLADRAFT_103083 [Melampsora larici-populina 98AG31]|uniref:F-box domain-containing protein n=1 Tax=Melampsora larici-populina (strain 98AG31 / pathotype 3-4-7) TaxID=747676 RepID=F4RAH7_MELLP|nr:uncharacterized protein MELLADRAFT_103083 [Melampsora larici-populina 98AG31]EGG10480.1 hypothetical protein MELLADRAFT_103083 [Melampsora larici-populina 98AG31]
MVGNELPVEVIDLILHHFMHESKQASTTERENTVDKPFLDRSAIGELLQLRLINSAWSGAVLQRIPISLPRDTCHKEFPRLKVIRSVEAKCKGRNIEWLKLKLFENMEVLITSYLRSKDYWRTVLSTHTISSFVKPARFNHVVFLTSMMVEDQDLVENFRKHGIQCHFKYQWTYQDISILPCGLSKEW